MSVWFSRFGCLTAHASDIDDRSSHRSFADQAMLIDRLAIAVACVAILNGKRERQARNRRCIGSMLPFHTP